MFECLLQRVCVEYEPGAMQKVLGAVRSSVCVAACELSLMQFVWYHAFTCVLLCAEVLVA